MGWFTDKIAGPLVVAFISAAVVGWIGMWGAVGAMGGRLDRHDDRASVILDRLDRLDREFHEFRQPGDRFTAADGNRVRESIRVVDQQCRRGAERIERIEATIEAFHRD